MSAVEALAEVLRGVAEKHDIGAYNGSQTACAWCRTWMTNAEYREHLADLQSAALVAAIRSMPAEQVAELIGGAVHHDLLPWVDKEKREGVATQGSKVYYRAVRVVTPWSPLGVSPETNGEG